jgi:hypothetical protein
MTHEAFVVRRKMPDAPLDCNAKLEQSECKGGACQAVDLVTKKWMENKKPGGRPGFLYTWWC